MQSRLKAACAVSAACVALIATVGAQQRAGYDYWAPQREMIQRGQQAIFMCNGLFTSQRTLRFNQWDLTREVLKACGSSSAASGK